MTNDDLIDPYTGERWSVPRTLDPLLPDSEVAEMLRKLARQHHGIAGHRDGSWTHCPDRWCRDVQAVLAE